MKVFGERLKELRINKKLSQDKLAKELDLTHTAIFLWENNKAIPNFEAVIKIAKYFDVSTDYLGGLEN